MGKAREREEKAGEGRSLMGEQITHPTSIPLDLMDALRLNIMDSFTATSF